MNLRRILVLLLGGLGFGVVTFRALVYRKRRLTYPAPLSMVRAPEVDASVLRRADGAFDLRLRRTDRPVQIFASTGPIQVERQQPLLTITNHNPIVIEGLESAARHYFTIVFPDGQRLVAAERRLPFAGIPNFRDLGGYRTSDGRHVRWGRVYRSGTLNFMTDADREYFQQLGVKLVCDLRSEQEVERDPDPLSPGMQHVHIPVYQDRGSSARLRALLFQPERLGDLLLQSYTELMIDASATGFGETLRRLANPVNLPALVHCSAGKDRTGIASALLLTVLGVSEEVVIADYTLSNYHFDDFRKFVGEALKPLARFGVTVDDAHLLLVANGDMLRSALGFVRERYGSVENYLTSRASLTSREIEQLKSNLLE